MRVLRSLLMMVGLLALVAGGAAAASPAQAEPPCHAQMSGHGSGEPSPDPKMQVMTCCVAWVVAPAAPAAPLAAVAATPHLLSPSLARQLTSLSPAPEIAPPRA